MSYEYRWNDWNIDHIGEHGISPTQAEYIINHPMRGFPRYVGDGKFLVHGQDQNGTYIQVMFILSPAEVKFVIHARPLNDAEKRRVRRKMSR